MKPALVAGVGTTETILIVLVALIPLALLVLFIIGIVRIGMPRRPREDQTWPLPGNPSPFQLHQAVEVRLQSVGVTPWDVRVERLTRTVTVELSRPTSPRIDDEIRKALAPLNVEIVWFEGSFEQVSRSPEGEKPS